MKLNEQIIHFCKAIESERGAALIVGGAVRDYVLGNYSPKDIDIEVYSLPLCTVQAILSNYGKVNCVGISFGVMKTRIGDIDVDVSLPRLDNKTGQGHKGFVVDMQSDLTPKEAAARRDFTINSMMYNPLTKLVIDPYIGKWHLIQRVLAPTSPAFAEDSLRVLRGMQFAARFAMTPHINLPVMALHMRKEFDTLPKERIFEEFRKMLEKGHRIDLGINFLTEVAWLQVFPQIYHMYMLPQDPDWHPEGCVLTHTGHVCNAMVRLCDLRNIQGEDRLVLMLAALCHDMGKATTTEFIDGRWRSPGHAQEGVPIARAFMESIGCYPRIIERVCPLVAEHMTHIGVVPNKRFVRRLSVRLGQATIDELCLLIQADMEGRPTAGQLISQYDESSVLCDIRMLAKELDIENDKPEPILRGHHLIANGYSPGPTIGRILAEAYEAQLDGRFDNLLQAMEMFIPIRKCVL